VRGALPRCVSACLVARFDPRFAAA